MSPSSVRDVRLATTGARAAGFFVDAAAMSAVPVLLFIGLSVSLPNDQNAPLSWASWVWVGALWASLTIFVIYPAWFIARRGRTPGMKRMGIRLYRVNREGTLSTPGWAHAWGRSGAAMACWCILAFGPAIDYLWSFENRQNQCLHDKLGRTVAVQEGDRRAWDVE